MKAYDWACAVWLFCAFAFPDWKLHLPFLGGSPGSSTTGTNPYVTEAGALAALLWTVLSTRRRLVPSWIWRVAGAWFVVFAFSFAAGMAHGNNLRTALTDLRFAMLPVYLVALAGVSLLARRNVLQWGASGFLVWAGVHAVIFAVEPAGLGSWEVLPIPVPSFLHDLPRVWCYPVFAMGAACLGVPWSRQVAISGTAWFFVWLSYLRGLWLGWPLAAFAGAAGFILSGRARESRRFLGGQITGMLVGLALVAGYLGVANRDGLFLLAFRFKALGHALHVTGPLKADYGAPAWVSPQLKAIARTGRLFHIKGAKGSVKQDVSVQDRGAMATSAMDIFSRHALLGAGLGTTYTYVVGEGIRKEWNNPHNGYWWWLSKTGMLGSLVILLIGFWSFIGVWRHRKFPRFAGLSVAVGALFLFCEMLNCGFGIHTVAIPLAIVAVFRPGYETTRARP